MGPSGSEKTTLLNMIFTIDSPTSGSVFIHNNNPYQLSPDDLALFRRQELGFVFQSFNLLHTLTVKENMVLPLVLDGMDVKRINKRIESISEKLAINELMKYQEAKHNEQRLPVHSFTLLNWFWRMSQQET